ncbi:MAG TPA: ribose-phosphate diphosphokinase [Armatimonadota bacterium]|nr:ribose-phosphate diphosphokinase [Armatimonadota bacterium]
MRENVNGMVIFTGNGSVKLAADTAAAMGTSVSPALVDKFANDEIRVQLQDNVRGKDVFIFQSFGEQVSDRLMELWLMIDAARRASAERITAVIPWYPYCKQERKFRGREPISARVVADLTVEAGADRILTMDLHEGAIQGFFDIPVDHLPNLPVFLDVFRREGLAGPKTVIVAPDAGAVERAYDIAGRLGCAIAVVFKHHPAVNVELAETVETVGDLENKRALLVDDFIFGGSTIVNAAREVMAAGALEVNACVTHAILCGDALHSIAESGIKTLYVTDTIPPRPGAPDKIRVVTIAPLLGEAIQRIHSDESIGALLAGILEDE